MGEALWGFSVVFRCAGPGPHCPVLWRRYVQGDSRGARFGLSARSDLVTVCRHADPAAGRGRPAFNCHDPAQHDDAGAIYGAHSHRAPFKRGFTL